MKPIFYRSKKNNECYKLIIKDDVTSKEMDNILDGLKEDEVTYITEEEFEKEYDQLMEIDVLNDEEDRVIMTFYTKQINMSAMDIFEDSIIFNN